MFLCPTLASIQQLEICHEEWQFTFNNPMAAANPPTLVTPFFILFFLNKSKAKDGPPNSGVRSESSFLHQYLVPLLKRKLPTKDFILWDMSNANFSYRCTVHSTSRERVHVL
jgi:hypothetical protein